MVGVTRVRRRAVGWSLAIAVVGLVGLSSCGADSEASAATVVEVRLGRFSIDPATVEVPAGDVELRVTNVDSGLPHNLVVAGKGTRTLAPGASETIDIKDIAVGEYRMWCDVQGHAQMGQVGSFVVVPVAAAAPTS